MDDGEAWPGRYRPCGAESDGCRAGRAPGSDATAINHFCLECDDLDATAAGLRSAGIQLTVEPMGSTIIVKAGIEYPDGNRIEFMQMCPKSMQAGGDRAVEAAHVAQTALLTTGQISIAPR